MPHLIGIAGPSGSGKTLLARTLAEALEAPIISLDSYYQDLHHLPLEDRAQNNFDDPDMLERDLLRRQLTQLAAGEEIDVPMYDFATHTRSSSTIRIQAEGFAILEGLWTLHWEDVRNLLGTKIYVDAQDDICFERRLNRDVRERGRTPESVIVQYCRTVRPMAEVYIWPSKRHADLVVSGVNSVVRNAETVLGHLEQHGLGQAAVAARTRLQR